MPDTAPFSEASKKILLLEHAIPQRERIEEANGGKRDKFTAELMEQCCSDGWRGSEV